MSGCSLRDAGRCIAVGVCEQNTIVGHDSREFGESTDCVRLRREAIEVIRFQPQQDCHLRAKIQKAATILTRLDNHLLTASEPATSLCTSHLCADDHRHLCADDHGWFKPGLSKNPAKQRRRGALAVSSGDRDALAVAHQFDRASAYS